MQQQTSPHSRQARAIVFVSSAWLPCAGQDDLSASSRCDVGSSIFTDYVDLGLGLSQATDDVGSRSRICFYGCLRNVYSLAIASFFGNTEGDPDNVSYTSISISD